MIQMVLESSQLYLISPQCIDFQHLPASLHPDCCATMIINAPCRWRPWALMAMLKIAPYVAGVEYPAEPGHVTV